MTPKDLKVFDVCKLRGGDYAIVLHNEFDKKYGLGLFVNDFGCVGYLGDYTDSFIKDVKGSEKYDIIKIYRGGCSEYSIAKEFFSGADLSHRNSIWERPKAKKLTVRQISDLLGYEVEIISEEQ